MNSEHARQIEVGRAESLNLAGIGRSYHNRSLADLPKGPDLVNWFVERGRSDLAQGKGWNIVGETGEARDTFMLLARGIHIKGFKVRQVPLRKLIANIVNETDMTEDLTLAPVLFISGFYSPMPHHPTPMSPLEAHVVEAFIMERLDNNGPVCVQSTVRIPQAAWWSKALTTRLTEMNTTMVIQ